MTIGTLYGVGVGPGDPELLTLKAARVLGEVDVVFTSSQVRSGRSLALEIAEPHLTPGKEVVALPFEHTFEGVASGAAHRANAERVLEVLRRPASAAFLTLGDPMTYSTFTYLLRALRDLEPRVPVAVVPGITSFAAAAAAAVEPLAEGEESLTVVSAARGPGRLAQALDLAENVVVMKPYRRLAEVCDLLDARGRGEQALYALRCTRPGERLLRGTDAARESGTEYMSLFLVHQAEGPR
ncbi:MAG: precorrin-2 C(20)-methyltransferase [Proteobacteria bacterium]|nr:precorrin-2 C(20)-methyltransferase [Pseudomonadota bacterium]